MIAEARTRKRPAAPTGGRRGRAGFTLVELLVVMLIILMISAVALPVILPALNHRQVSEAARILQGALVGARDAAVHANAPRGIRLLPDPTLITFITDPTSPQVGQVDQTAVLAAFDPDRKCNPGKVLPTPRLCGERPGPWRPHPLEQAGVIERF